MNDGSWEALAKQGVARVAELEGELRFSRECIDGWGRDWSHLAKQNAALVARVNTLTELNRKLVSQLRDYRNSHHSEHPSQEGKEVCSYSWCANATRLIGESARQDVQPCGCQGSRCEGWCEVNLGEDTSNDTSGGENG